MRTIFLLMMTVVGADILTECRLVHQYLFLTFTDEFDKSINNIPFNVTGLDDQGTECCVHAYEKIVTCILTDECSAAFFKKQLTGFTIHTIRGLNSTLCAAVTMNNPPVYVIDNDDGADNRQIGSNHKDIRVANYSLEHSSSSGTTLLPPPSCECPVRYYQDGTWAFVGTVIGILCAIVVTCIIIKTHV